MQPSTFFISYRREDSAPLALLLKYELEKRLKFVRVFVDVTAIVHGDNWQESVEANVAEADAFILLIGKGGLRRASNTADAAGDVDWVLAELDWALHKPLLADDGSKKERAIFPIFVDRVPSFVDIGLPEALNALTKKQTRRIDHAEWPSAIGPLIEKLAEVLKIEGRPNSDEYPTPSPSKARTQPLSEADLAAILKYDDYAGWFPDNYGNVGVRYLVKVFKFADFDQAATFMRLVSDYCQVLNHHPEWKNVYSVVTASLTTWDARRQITIYDLNLALYMNKAEKKVKGIRD